MLTQQFRDKVTNLLDSGEYGKAIALNQEEYGRMPGFIDSLKTKEGRAASDSFFEMIKANPSFERIKLGDNNKIRINQHLNLILEVYLMIKKVLSHIF